MSMHEVIWQCDLCPACNVRAEAAETGLATTEVTMRTENDKLRADLDKIARVVRDAKITLD